MGPIKYVLYLWAVLLAVLAVLAGVSYSGAHRQANAAKARLMLERDKEQLQVDAIANLL